MAKKANNGKTVDITFTQEELDDLLSALGMAMEVAKEKHEDSPEFRAALAKLNSDLWEICKEL